MLDIFRFSAILLVSGTFAPWCSAAITYHIPALKTSKAGWAFHAGHITTDGTLGEIGPDRFIDWSVSFSTPSGEHLLTRDNSHAVLIIEDSLLESPPGVPSHRNDPLALVATNEAILIPPVGVGSRFSVLSLNFAADRLPWEFRRGYGLHFGRTSGGTSGLLKNCVVAGLFDYTGIDEVRYDGTTIPSFEVNAEAGAGLHFSQPGDVVAAVMAVPEPGSPAALACAVISAMICRPRRSLREPARPRAGSIVRVSGPFSHTSSSVSWRLCGFAMAPARGRTGSLGGRSWDRAAFPQRSSLKHLSFLVVGE